MRESELQLVYDELKQLRAAIGYFENRVDSIERDIRLKLEPILEERDLLLNRVDPYAGDGKSLADWNEF